MPLSQQLFVSGGQRLPIGDKRVAISVLLHLYFHVGEQGDPDVGEYVNPYSEQHEHIEQHSRGIDTRC